MKNQQKYADGKFYHRTFLEVDQIYKGHLNIHLLRYGRRKGVKDNL